MGKLVDVSEGGVGLETFSKIPQGQVVKIEAELRQQDFGLDLQGRARVVHATRQMDGSYRLGLQLVDVAYARAS